MIQKRYTPHKGEKGFTLIELLVAISISSLLFIGIMTFLVTSLVNNSIRSARADLLREAQLSLDVMVKDIRLSASSAANNSVEDIYSPDAAATNGYGWESDVDTLVLNTAATNESNEIIFADASHYISEKDNIIYYVENGTLYKRTLANEVPGNSSNTTCPPEDATDDCPSDRLSVKNVYSLQFRYYDGLGDEVEPENARAVEVSLNLRTQKYGREVDVNYSTRTVFRNE